MQHLVRGLRDAGVPLLAGTDDMVPSRLPGFAMKDELVQLTESDLTPFEALQSATPDPARFLGIDARMIEPGRVADLILPDASPLNDPSNVFRQAGVMLHDSWLMEDVLQDQPHALALALLNDALRP